MLAGLISQGDRGAEQELLTRLYRPMLMMLKRRTGDAFLAEDLTQEALSLLLERLRGAGIENPEKLSSFAHRTALNLLIGRNRKQARRQTYPDSELIERTHSSDNSNLETLLRREEDSAVRSLLAELSTPRYRDLLQRTYLYQEAKLDVCQALNLSPDQFDKIHYRAKKRFRQLVETRLKESS